MESLEILLLLFATLAKELSPLEVSRTLYTSLESATVRLCELHEAKLLMVTEAIDAPKY